MNVGDAPAARILRDGRVACWKPRCRGEFGRIEDANTAMVDIVRVLAGPKPPVWVLRLNVGWHLDRETSTWTLGSRIEQGHPGERRKRFTAMNGEPANAAFQNIRFTPTSIGMELKTGWMVADAGERLRCPSCRALSVWPGLPLA